MRRFRARSRRRFAKSPGIRCGRAGGSCRSRSRSASSGGAAGAPAALRQSAEASARLIEGRSLRLDSVATAFYACAPCTPAKKSKPSSTRSSTWPTPTPSRSTLTGGERSGTRWANSSITVNLVQYDRNVTANVRFGQKTGSANTRDFSDAGLKAMVDEAVAEAKAAARQSEPAGAARPAGVHPRRRRAAEPRELRPGRTRAHGEGQHRPVGKDGHGRRRLHPEERSDQLHGQLEGPVRVLPRRRDRLRADVPHARRQPARAGPASPASKTSR